MSVLLVLIGTVTSAAVAAGSIAVPACARGGPCVVVQVIAADGSVTSSTEFDADTILGAGADISDASYPIKGGAPASVKPGSSVHRLLGLVPGLDLSTVTYTDVVWDDVYERHLLTGQEVRGDGAAAGFQGGLVPAFYSTDPGAPQRLTYIRPQRDTDDDNGAPGPDQGSRFTDQQGAFLVRVHQSGTILDVGVTATATDATNRTFRLSTDQAGAGQSFDWVLPDQTRSTEASPTFTFPRSSLAGTVAATVGVSAPDGSFGWGSVDLRVGPPAPEPASPTATATGTGGKGGAKKGPVDNPAPGAPADPGLGPGTGPGSPGPAPSAAATTSPGTTAPGSALAPPPGAEPPVRPNPQATQLPAQAPGSLTGILLAAGQPIEPVAGAATADAAPPSASAAPVGSTPFRISTAVWVGTGIAMLLLGGAGSESTRLRHWLSRRVRTT